ncbi:hypothetical protein DYU11_15500 [Fibrisoma montanum]|uniref:Uncharacterized protein n=1 Tax=Fibrisoma montanum TaxID=2305895 RepID=A0A418M8K8_9BACT|nr:hypothetical protein [Fibrisoma montanum]RIV22419.1 hypothetical protein DYU11_15500 [Fibrisoma montanum]
MESTIPSSFSPSAEAVRSRAIDWRLGIPTYVYAVVFASLCIVWGLLWDIMWHISIGRDGLFAPPHLVMYVGAVVSGLFSGYQILSMTFQKKHPERAGSVRFWGVFYGSLGALYCVWGAMAMLTSAPFDDWWHNTYGLDVQILTPPHTVLVLGMMMVQFGAMIGVLALQNRTRSQTLTNDLDQRRASRLKLLFGIAAGLLLTVLYVLLSENMGKWLMHNSLCYTTAAIAFPIYLLAVGRASMLKNPITIITAVYMITLLLPNWILPLFSATPKLGPVYNPITTYQAFSFPLLLIVPAFALDQLMKRYKGNDWILAGLAAVVFMVLFLAVQWPFGEFLHTSPYARNWFFLSNAWSYDSPPDWKYRYEFHPGLLEPTAVFAKNFAFAILYAAISARIGLWWGNWMKRVVR